MGKALFTRSDFDLATKYLSSYGTKLVDFAKTNGWSVVDLYGENTNTVQFETEIATKPQVFMGLSHGNETVFTGQNNGHATPLIKQGVNDDCLKDIKTYLWACLTGKSLGPVSVTSGCPEYYGYSTEWTFMMTEGMDNKPLEDPIAMSFFDSALTTGYAMLLNKSPKEVFDSTINRYDYWWDYWSKQEHELADDIMTWLNANKNSFVAITPSETFEQPEQLGVNLTEVAKVVIPVAAASLFLIFVR